jgi:predicted Holliday junction resolvase-like endonuclease
VLRGRITEQLAPLLPDFGFDPADARFIGNPVDFVVFDGYEEVRLGTRQRLRGIAFIDIKTGRATLTTIERRIKLAIEERNLWCHALGTQP